MQRILMNSLLLSALGLGVLLGAAHAAAEPGLPLDPSSVQPIDDPVTGSANTFSKTLSSLSGSIGAPAPTT
ncbi:hypothetical protein AB0M22_03190 [Nocardia sp. NPDC051756]|uniref:hypothetical protein n=1 Tax=Nocardia sp. NPDC051756 TaxID=3154751 RepID=UPI0034365A5F